MGDKFYKGKYSPKNPQKYEGDSTQIFYRSSWELMVFDWLDKNDSVVSWSSEELIIPYICSTDNRQHRYFPDVRFKIKSEDSTIKTYIVEIKPKKYTVAPKIPKRKSKRFLEETLQYVKNQSKWKAANEFAMRKNAIFMVWTEDTIKKLGIRLIT